MAQLLKSGIDWHHLEVINISQNLKKFFSRLLPSYIEYWKRAFDFHGRTKRIDFWATMFVATVINFVIVLSVLFIDIFSYDLGAIENFDSSESIRKSWFYAAWELINGVPLFAIEIRRVRDAGAKSWVMALALCGLISTILIVIGGPLVPAISSMPEARVVLFVGGIPPLVYTFLPSANVIVRSESINEISSR